MSIQAGINRIISLAGAASAVYKKTHTADKPKKPDAVSAKAEEKVAARSEEIQRSREFAKMITEGVPNLSFNPDEYVPPERKEK